MKEINLADWKYVYGNKFTFEGICAICDQPINSQEDHYLHYVCENVDRICINCMSVAKQKKIKIEKEYPTPDMYVRWEKNSAIYLCDCCVHHTKQLHECIRDKVSYTYFKYLCPSCFDAWVVYPTKQKEKEKKNKKHDSFEDLYVWVNEGPSISYCHCCNTYTTGIYKQKTDTKKWSRNLCSSCYDAKKMRPSTATKTEQKKIQHTKDKYIMVENKMDIWRCSACQKITNKAHALSGDLCHTTNNVLCSSCFTEHVKDPEPPNKETYDALKKFPLLNGLED